jgi:alpha-aminoadipate carrier protein LysW
MAKADCPACGANINIGPKPRMGQRIKCTTCSTELEVVWLEPIELDWPYDEDDEDEFDEEDDYEESF